MICTLIISIEYIETVTSKYLHRFLICKICNYIIFRIISVANIF